MEEAPPTPIELFLYELLNTRENEIVLDQRKNSAGARACLEELLLAANCSLAAVPVARSPEGDLDPPPPASPPKVKELRLRSNPQLQTAAPPAPSTKGLVKKLAARLLEREREWREGDGEGDEKVPWLVENASVTEQEAGQSLEACDFVLADAYQALIFGA